MNKKIMILGASILQLPAIKKAKKMGLSIVVVDMDPEAIGFKEDGIEKEVISTIDVPKVLDAARKHKIDGIMTLASDMPMRTIAVVSKQMNIPGVTEETALKATNKALMRDALKHREVPIPMFFKVNTKTQIIEAVERIRDAGYRCIVKPADNSGSRGVTLLSDFEKYTILKAYEYGKRFSRSGDLIVEEFMEGPEVSVETISINGECYVLQITDKLTTGAPYFVEMGHSQPSDLPEDVKEKIILTAKKAVKAIGIENGPSHTEIKVTKDGPKIVELGARLGGDCITTHLVPLSTGIDMVECCINIALGQKPDLNKKVSKASAIRYLDSKIGQIKSISGVEKAKAINGICQISIVHQEGEYAREIKSSNDRIGFVIATADDAMSAVKICDNAKSMIKVEVENENSNSNANIV